MSNSTEMPKLYLELATRTFQPLLTGLAGGKALIGVIGIVLNLELVYITAVTTTFYGFCNLLIAAEALSEAIYELSFVISFIVLATSTNLLSLPTCFYVQVMPSFMKYFSAGLMVAIGLNRLKCVVFAFGEMMCTTSEISQGQAAQVVYICALTMNIASPIIYCLLGLALLKREQKFAQRGQQYQDKTGKLFKSIFIIMLVQLLGWGSNSVFIFLAGSNRNSNYASQTSMSLAILGTYPLALATAANGPILYFCSYDYRNAINAHLRKIVNFREFSTNSNQMGMGTVPSYPQNHNARSSNAVQPI